MRARQRGINSAAPYELIALGSRAGLTTTDSQAAGGGQQQPEQRHTELGERWSFKDDR